MPGGWLTTERGCSHESLQSPSDRPRRVSRKDRGKPSISCVCIPLQALQTPAVPRGRTEEASRCGVDLPGVRRGRQMTTVYTVHAYRWGDRQRHSYTVGVFADEGSALQAAIEEEDLRGGKYVCEVLQMTIGTVIAGTSRPHDKRFKVVKALPDIDYAPIWLDSAEIRKDTARLRYVMDACLVRAEKDRYEYAMEVAKENGRDEPTADDCLDGFRRLIDCSMSGGDVETGEE